MDAQDGLYLNFSPMYDICHSWMRYFSRIIFSIKIANAVPPFGYWLEFAFFIDSSSHHIATVLS